MTDPRILIVGAGIAGLAAARALHRSGFALDIVERGWTSEGSGIYLPANAIRALKALGLEQATLARGTIVTHQRFSDHHGRLLFDVDVARLWSGVGECLALHRTDLHSILLGSISDVPIRTGVKVRGLGSTSGPVVVEFDDGTSAGYDLVLAADGINSSVRLVPFAMPPRQRRVGQLGWRFVTACPAEVTTWSVMLGHRTSFLTLPIGNDRVFGDAAHATLPNMAEGAAMALEDAVVLAECLSTAPLPAALAAFEARRRPRTNWVRSQTHRRDRIRYLPTTVRNMLLQTFGQSIFRSNYRPLLAAY